MSNYGVRIDDGPLHEFDTLADAERFVRIVALGRRLRSPDQFCVERLSPVVAWYLLVLTILLAWWAT